jgi:hypothetical protein
MGIRRVGAVALAVFGLGAILWAVAGPGLPGAAPRAEAQQGGRARAGKFEFVPAGFTVVMIDTENAKTYALAAPVLHGLGGVTGGEFAWVPIRKFDDVEGYRKWIKEHHEMLFRDKKDKPAVDKPARQEFKKDVDKKSVDAAKDKGAAIRPRPNGLQASHDRADNLAVRGDGADLRSRQGGLNLAGRP